MSCMITSRFMCQVIGMNCSSRLAVSWMVLILGIITHHSKLPSDKGTLSKGMNVLSAVWPLAILCLGCDYPCLPSCLLPLLVCGVGTSTIHKNVPMTVFSPGTEVVPLVYPNNLHVCESLWASGETLSSTRPESYLLRNVRGQTLLPDTQVLCHCYG